MNEWIFAFSGLMAGGIAAYLWQRRVAAGERTRQDALLSDAEAQRINAEREKSNAEVMLKAKCNEIEQLRRDGVEGLKRQAEQFREEIQALNGRIDDGDRKIQAEREQKEDLAKRLAAAEETQKASERLFKEREDQYKKTLEQGAAHFKELAQKILEDREQKLKNDATNPLSELVKQLKTDIDNLKTQISSSNEKSATSHVDLVNKITNLVNQTNKVTEQANNLAGAIRGDSRFMGEWGEIQLKRILDMSQMDEGTSYTYQETFVDEDKGRRSKRTDFVIKMPEGRALIIDSKCTLAAAERYHAAADDAERSKAENEIVASVRSHVEEIKAADYQASVKGAFPCVLMYIPMEEVYMLAMKATIVVSGERELLRDYAQRNNVVFVNSASVFPVVRLIEMLWNVDRTERNRQETIRAAEELLQRANDFVTEFLAVGDAFKNVFGKYDAAKKRLIDGHNGQSIAKAAAKLVNLGVQPKTRGNKTYALAEPIADDVIKN